MLLGQASHGSWFKRPGTPDCLFEQTRCHVFCVLLSNTFNILSMFRIEFLYAKEDRLQLLSLMLSLTGEFISLVKLFVFMSGAVPQRESAPQGSLNITGKKNQQNSEDCVTVSQTLPWGVPQWHIPFLWNKLGSSQLSFSGKASEHMNLCPFLFCYLFLLSQAFSSSFSFTVSASVLFKSLLPTHNCTF